MPNLLRPATGEVSRFEWSNDPADPCGYCVHWDEPENMHSGNFEEAAPMLPDGPAARLYRFTHDDCEKAVMAYIEESSHV